MALVVNAKSNTVKFVARILVAALFVGGLSACTTYQPKVASKQPYLDEDCQLVTRKLYLNKFRAKGNKTVLREVCRDISACAVVMLSSGAWTVGSLVVSGSVTATGNILHWMEYQGRCELDQIKDEIFDFTTTSSSPSLISG